MKKGERLIVNAVSFEKIGSMDREPIENKIGRLAEFFEVAPETIFTI